MEAGGAEEPPSLGSAHSYPGRCCRASPTTPAGPNPSHPKEHLQDYSLPGSVAVDPEAEGGARCGDWPLGGAGPALPAPTEGDGGDDQSLALAAGCPFSLPASLPPGPRVAFHPVGGAPTREQRRLAVGAAGSSSEAGSGTSSLRTGSRWGPDGHAAPARRRRLQPRTCPHKSGGVPRVRPLPSGLASASGSLAPASHPVGPRVRGERARHRRGRARPPTPGRQPVRASPAPGPPPLPAPETPRRGSCHLSRPPRRPWPPPALPAAGPQSVGAAEGRGRAATHRALCRRRRARLPAVPRAWLLGAEARPPAQRCARSAPCPRPSASGLRLPLPAAAATAPAWPQPPGPESPSWVCGPRGPAWASGPGIRPGGPTGGRQCSEEGVLGQERSPAARWAPGGD
ncbi:LOW QUALITY PROTEIN: proapoptotic nucleolar protein 1 [Lontra canadensis]|uniref:LOW QUALITY PROTEIN: proapoptotic nucleolar protein 1 n=1 Tax=Lontra canadensis TaxID=76717 RepID=UPI0013F33C0D|nr:LOW QUALITY PROTEIN: proapoptotic nucleolar protein 1 [Lontra canadensis]